MSADFASASFRLSGITRLVALSVVLLIGILAAAPGKASAQAIVYPMALDFGVVPNNGEGGNKDVALMLTSDEPDRQVVSIGITSGAPFFSVLHHGCPPLFPPALGTSGSGCGITVGWDSSQQEVKTPVEGMLEIVLADPTPGQPGTVLDVPLRATPPPQRVEAEEGCEAAYCGPAKPNPKGKGKGKPAGKHKGAGKGKRKCKGARKGKGKKKGCAKHKS